MSGIRFFNTLTGNLDSFVSSVPGEVRMYTCGPTVYDFAHIGNFRAFVFEDLLRRFLEFKGFRVSHVMNLTDVDDKTILGAQRKGISLEAFTAPFIQAFVEDLQALNCLAPTLQPRATRKISLMLNMIQTLVDKGAAYSKDGSVYYRVAKFPGYGKLSKKKLEMNITGASERVDSDEYESKEEVSDFVLWKGAKEGEKELGATWDSPWGPGRPGWHIECSAMSVEALGPSFDIHAGGEDLIFPHHENEIAQSESATGVVPFSRFWLHCKFLLVDGEKMSKSKGNFYTLRDLLSKGYDPAAIRYSLLTAHYRSPLNFTLEGLKESSETIKRLDDCYWQVRSRLELDISGQETEVLSINADEIFKGLGDDLNIAACLAELFEIVKKINAAVFKLGRIELEKAAQFFEDLDRLLGLSIALDKVIPADIRALMTERAAVRAKVKEDKSLWAVSDALRDKIQALGWLVKDGKPGEPSTLKKKRRVWDK